MTVDPGVGFKIGVTGHRNIDQHDHASLVQSASRALARIKELMPDTRLSLITGLADGADRILAQVALDLG